MGEEIRPRSSSPSPPWRRAAGRRSAAVADPSAQASRSGELHHLREPPLHCRLRRRRARTRGELAQRQGRDGAGAAPPPRAAAPAGPRARRRRAAVERPRAAAALRGPSARGSRDRRSRAGSPRRASPPRRCAPRAPSTASTTPAARRYPSISSHPFAYAARVRRAFLHPRADILRGADAAKKRCSGRASASAPRGAATAAPSASRRRETLRAGTRRGSTTRATTRPGGRSSGRWSSSSTPACARMASVVLRSLDVQLIPGRRGRTTGSRTCGSPPARAARRAARTRGGQPRRSRGRGGTRPRLGRAGAPCRRYGTAPRSRPGGRTAGEERSPRARPSRRRPASPSSQLNALEREQPALQLRGRRIRSRRSRSPRPLGGTGSSSENRFSAQNDPAARAAPGRPARAASSPYETTSPHGIARAAAASSRCSGVAHSRSIGMPSYDVGDPREMRHDAAAQIRHEVGTSGDGSGGSVRCWEPRSPVGGARRARRRAGPAVRSGPSTMRRVDPRLGGCPALVPVRGRSSATGELVLDDHPVPRPHLADAPAGHVVEVPRHAHAHENTIAAMSAPGIFRPPAAVNEPVKSYAAGLARAGRAPRRGSRRWPPSASTSRW